MVGISSAFPPILSPVTLSLNTSDWQKTDISSSYDQRTLKSKLLLTDGGLYDNLGLEALTKADGGYSHAICCDAGAPFEVKADLPKNWISQFFRMTDIMINQQRALRKRKLISDFSGGRLKGAYFGIGSSIDEYQYIDSMTHDSADISSLAKVSTRLKAFSQNDINKLINWGYALSDTAIQKWCPDIVGKVLTERRWPNQGYKL